MKNFFLVLLSLSTLIVNAQIYTQSSGNGSITITPKGLKGNATNEGMHGNTSFGGNALNTLSESAWGNTAIGAETLSLNTTGDRNTATGYWALSKNTQGYENTATGVGALYLNTTGYWNTANGNMALNHNTIGGGNTATGYAAIHFNMSGIYNSGYGFFSLYTNQGNFNTASGARALYGNLSGNNNTANGFESLYSNAGNENTAIGYQSGANNKANSNSNTFLGAFADAIESNISNSTAIGYKAFINQSNKVRIGDTNVTVIEGQVAWSNPSDRRLKENIIYSNLLGLDFINRLQTTSYNYKADKNKTRYDGFIAQDVEQVTKDLGVPFSGLKKSDDGTYSLAYSDFVMPLVNAVKEQQQQIQQQQKQIDEMKKQYDTLAERLSILEQLSTKTTISDSAENFSKSVPQSVPNKKP